MTAALAWKPPRSAMSNNFSGLLDKLVAKHGISALDHEAFQAFINESGNGVALLTEEPDTAPESWDMAVIFPELLAAIGTQLRASVVRPESAKILQTRFGLAGCLHYYSCVTVVMWGRLKEYVTGQNLPANSPRCCKNQSVAHHLWELR